MVFIRNIEGLGVSIFSLSELCEELIILGIFVSWDRIWSWIGCW